MTTAPTIDREKLVKLCGLFSSDHAGERANAAAVADAMVRKAGLRWPDVILPALPPPPDATPTISAPFAACVFCLNFRDVLTSWEAEFCRSIATQTARGAALSAKQNRVLARIVAKCRRSEADEF